MKQLRFTGMLLCATLIFLLTSCDGGGDEDKPDTGTTNADTTKTVTPEVNTIVTTPQLMMIATHKVADFAKWKAAYDGHDSMRLANGIHSYVIGRGFNDSNMVLVAVKADDLAKAKAFANSADLKKAMQKGGVIGAPSISFYTATWQDTATLAAGVLRSRTEFSVKDWAAWEKSFMGSKQVRLDNGITDRVIGHDPDNDKKVTLVTAVVDTAKAFAFYKSDELKKIREASGAIGEPNRFLFYVVTRY